MKHLNRLTAAAILLGGLGAAGAAAAQDAPPPEPSPAPPMAMPMEGPMAMGGHGRGPVVDFVAIDTDGDGVLTRIELGARATARLATSDGNGDGVLDRAEIIAALPDTRDGLMMVFAPNPAEARADRLLAFMGATETGQVEVVALGERQVNGLLARLDRDRDGAISLAEAEAAAKRGHGRMHGHEGEHEGHGWGRPRD